MRDNTQRFAEYERFLTIAARRDVGTVGINAPIESHGTDAAPGAGIAIHPPAAPRAPGSAAESATVAGTEEARGRRVPACGGE